MITMVLGGASSGKSVVAERLVARHPKPVTYVATGLATDEEMAARIRVHQARRPAWWRLVEVNGPELVSAVASLTGTVLLDSLGTWMASLYPSAIDDAGLLCGALMCRDGDTVLVSDEVGLGVHPATELGRHFRDDLGRLNTAIADVADEVLLVVAGRILPLELLD